MWLDNQPTIYSALFLPFFAPAPAVPSKASTREGTLPRILRTQDPLGYSSAQPWGVCLPLTSRVTKRGRNWIWYSPPTPQVQDSCVLVSKVLALWLFLLLQCYHQGVVYGGVFSIPDLYQSLAKATPNKYSVQLKTLYSLWKMALDTLNPPTSPPPLLFPLDCYL